MAIVHSLVQDARDNDAKRIAMALERADKLEDIYQDAKIRGVPVESLMRLDRAHKAVTAVSSHEERMKILLFARNTHSALADQIRYIAEKYEELAASKR